MKRLALALIGVGFGFVLGFIFNETEHATRRAVKTITVKPSGNEWQIRDEHAMDTGPAPCSCCCIRQRAPK